MSASNDRKEYEELFLQEGFSRGKQNTNNNVSYEKGQLRITSNVIKTLSIKGQTCYITRNVALTMSRFKNITRDEKDYLLIGIHVIHKLEPNFKHGLGRTSARFQSVDDLITNGSFLLGVYKWKTLTKTEIYVKAVCGAIMGGKLCKPKENGTISENRCSLLG